MKKWCEDVSKETGDDWRYFKVLQKDFEEYPFTNFRALVDYLEEVKK